MILSAYFAQIRWLHIIVAGIAYFLLGWLWFSLLFGKPWAKLQERDMSKVDKGAAARSMAISFVANFLLVITVGLFCYALGAKSILGGLKVGLALGLGISAVNYLNMFVFSGKKWPLFLIDRLPNCGHRAGRGDPGGLVGTVELPSCSFACAPARRHSSSPPLTIEWVA